MACFAENLGNLEVLMAFDTGMLFSPCDYPFLSQSKFITA